MAGGYRDNGASLIVSLVGDYRDRAERKAVRKQTQDNADREFIHRGERETEADRRWGLSNERADEQFTETKRTNGVTEGFASDGNNRAQRKDDRRVKLEGHEDEAARLYGEYNSLDENGVGQVTRTQLTRDLMTVGKDVDVTGLVLGDKKHMASSNVQRGNSGRPTAIVSRMAEDGNAYLFAKYADQEALVPYTKNPNDPSSYQIHLKGDTIAPMVEYQDGINKAMQGNEALGEENAGRGAGVKIGGNGEIRIAGTEPTQVDNTQERFEQANPDDFGNTSKENVLGDLYNPEANNRADKITKTIASERSAISDRKEMIETKENDPYHQKVTHSEGLPKVGVDGQTRNKEEGNAVYEDRHLSPEEQQKNKTDRAEKRRLRFNARKFMDEGAPDETETETVEPAVEAEIAKEPKAIQRKLHLMLSDPTNGLDQRPTLRKKIANAKVKAGSWNPTQGDNYTATGDHETSKADLVEKGLTTRKAKTDHLLLKAKIRKANAETLKLSKEENPNSPKNKKAALALQKTYNSIVNDQIQFAVDEITRGDSTESKALMGSAQPAFMKTMTAQGLNLADFTSTYGQAAIADTVKVWNNMNKDDYQFTTMAPAFSMALSGLRVDTDKGKEYLKAMGDYSLANDVNEQELYTKTLSLRKGLEAKNFSQAQIHEQIMDSLRHGIKP